MSTDRRYFDNYFKEILDGFLIMEYPYESLMFKRDINNYESGHRLDLYLNSSELGPTNIGYVYIKDGDESYLKLSRSKYKTGVFKIDESSIIYDIFNLMDHVYNESKWFRDELKKVENRIIKMTNDQYFTDISDCTYNRLYIKKNKNFKTEMKINENKGSENKVMEYDLFTDVSKQVDETIEKMFDNLIELIMHKNALIDKQIDIKGRTTFIIKIKSFEENIFKIQYNGYGFKLFMKLNPDEDVVCIDRPKRDDIVSDFYKKIKTIYKNLSDLELLKNINDMISITDCALNNENASEINKITNQLKLESDDAVSSIASGSKSYKNMDSSIFSGSKSYKNMGI